MSPDPDKALAGKVVVVTGASRGIGKGLALGLARLGAPVVCAARTVSEDPGGLPGTIHATVDAIRAEGGDAVAVRCDIGQADDIAQLVDTTIAEFGRLDVLINNAMASTRALFADATPDQWDESMRINVRSLFVTAKAVVPVMASNGGGSIVNISSGAADHAVGPHMPPGYLIYTVAKAARERFSTALELQNQLEDFAHDNRLRVSPLVLARLMSTLFPARLEEWDHARAQGAFFVEQHVVRTLIESGKTADSSPRYLPQPPGRPLGEIPGDPGSSWCFGSDANECFCSSCQCYCRGNHLI